MSPSPHKVIAVIPARGGSKGVPFKNMRPLNGTPLIGHTIKAAKESRFIDKIWISSDDEKILEYSHEQGGDTSYPRPAHLGNDETTITEVMDDLLQHRREEINDQDLIVLLQPTSPLRTSQDIDQAFDLYLEKKTTTLVSVSRMKEHPYKSLTQHEASWNFLASPPNHLSRRQDYPNAYFTINGAIYITTIRHFKEKRLFVVEGTTTLFEMPSEKSVDIDTEADFQLAEILFKLSTDLV